MPFNSPSFNSPSTGVGEVVDLTAEVTGILPIANGGTNSSTALNNAKLMKSVGGAIVESGIGIDASNNVSGVATIAISKATSTIATSYIENQTVGATSQVELQLKFNGTPNATWFSTSGSFTSIPNIVVLRGVQNASMFLGANNTNHIEITSGGSILMPNTPAFLAYLGTTDSNSTGNGTLFQLGSGNALTEVFDQGSNFNPATGVFTAPVTGRYRFEAHAHIIGCTIATDMQVRVVTSNRTAYVVVNSRAAGAQGWGLGGSILIDMDAGDTAHVIIATFGEAGATDDIFGTATDPFTYFSGNLEC